MQALAEFAEITYGTAADMSVLIRAGPDFEHTFKVKKDNALVLQRVEVGQRLLDEISVSFV